MEVKRYKGPYENNYDYYINYDNKTLAILFGGNLDLYWILTIKEKDNKIQEQVTDMYHEVKGKIIITKENYFIYTLFEQLYNDIKECNIFKSNILFKTCSEENSRYKNSIQYRNLYSKEKITWYSDDYDLSVADYVTIKKLNDTYEIEFIRPKITENSFIIRSKNTVTIRFRNSGSRYNPFNIIFMNMYNHLQEYNPEFHQLHIEESLYKKLTLKK